MNNLEKYLDEVIEHKPTVHSLPPAVEEESQPNILKALLRRWYIVVTIFIIFCLVGLPAIWLLIKPRYVMTGSVWVVPLIPNILTGQSDRGDISNYEIYVNTQASRILSDPMLERVAKDLATRDLTFFQAKASSSLIDKISRRLELGSASTDPVDRLRQAVMAGEISAAPIRRTEYIGVTAKSQKMEEARQIVDSFLTHFKVSFGVQATDERNSTLGRLQNESKTLASKIEDQHAQVMSLTKEHATTDLDSAQQMEMQIQASLWTELTRIGARKVSLEARIAVLEQTTDSNVPADQLVAARKNFVSLDPMIQELTKNIVQVERDLIVAKEQLAPSNPELTKRQSLLDAFRTSLEEKEKELEAKFDEQVAGQGQTIVQQRLAAAKAELEQLKAYEERLNAVLVDQEDQTRGVGQASVQLRDIEFKMRVDRQLYDQMVHQIKTLEIQKQQESRIEIGQYASLAQVEDKRVKFTGALLFAGLACGCGLALLRDKTDKTLETPDDVARYLALPLLGTTTCSRTVKPAQFAEQIAGDYQAIRTNLSLQANGTTWRRMAVCSPGMREGKTTFSVNLATSLAKSGKKVLLIDGDLRKPDVRRMLKMSNGTLGVQDVLLGEEASLAVVSLSDSGLHVLPANSRHLADAYELLVSPTAKEQMERLGREYDHVIIDTPPALAFPDAQVWATLADAVVLVGFAGRTTAEELKKAEERLSRVRARVLGVILSNVAADQGLYRYSYEYAYRARPMSPMGHGGKQRRLLHDQPPSEEPKN